MREKMINNTIEMVVALVLAVITFVLTVDIGI